MFRKILKILVTVCLAAVAVGSVFLSCRETVNLPPVEGPPLAVPEARGGGGGGAVAVDQALKVIYSSPRGQLTSPHLQLTVSFNKPMVALERAEDQALNSPLVMQPAVEGKQRWLGTRTLIFQPSKPLAGSADYRVRIPAGVKALDGSALKQELSFGFTTPLLKVARVSPTRNRKWMRPDTRMTLYFNQPVSPETLTRHLTLQAAPHTKRAGRDESTTLAVKATQGKNPRQMHVRATTPLPLDSRISISLSPQMTGLEGPKAMGKAYKSSFHTYGPFVLQRLSCVDACDPEGSVRLRFSNPVRRDRARRATRVEGKRLRAGRAKYFGAALYLDHKLGPRKRYTVQVDNTLRDKFGQRLQGDTRRSFSTGDFSPYVYFPLDNGVLEPRGPMKLPIYFRNANRARLLSRPMKPADVAALLGHGQYWDNEDALLEGFSGHQQQQLEVAGKANERVAKRVNLLKLLRARRGILALELDSTLRDGKQKRRFVRRAVVRITDLALTAKYSPQASLVWVTSLSGGLPVAGAEVSIWRPKGKKPLWRGTTDAAGVARAPGVGELLKGQDREQRDFLFFAAKDGDLSYVSSRSQSGISPWDFGFDASWDDGAGALLGLMLSDRGIYRPGDTVHVKGVLRRDGPRGLETPRDLPLELTISDSRGEKLQTEKLRLSEFGTLALKLELPPGAPLGTYSVVARPKQGGTVRGSFRVEEYRPAEFKVAVKPERRQYVRGDKLGWGSDAAYLFGAPMRAAPLSWTLYRSISHFTPPGNEGFRFSDDVWYWRRSRDTGGFVARGKGKLDARGHFSGSTLLKPALMTRPYTYELEASVTDISRQSIAARSTVVLHPAEFYVGGKVGQTFLKAGDSLETQVVAAAPDGKRVAGVSITGSLFRQEWHSVRKKGMGGAHYFVSQPSLVQVGSCQLQSARTPRPCKIKVPRAGYYILRLRASDKRRNPVASSFGVYASGADYVPWRRDSEDRVELVLDRKVYKVGQTARILVKSPYARAHGLMTVERNGITTVKPFTLDSTSAWLRVPITPDLVPNAYLGVVLVRGRVAVPPKSKKKADRFAEEDPGKPAFKVGYAQLKISHADRRLQVAVAPERESYRPGEQVNLELTVRDARGKPTRAELTVIVADEGVLSLMGYKLPDPMAVFYASRGLSVHTADNRIRLLSRRIFGDKGNNPGGGGAESGESDNGGVRRKFVSTPFFDPAVLTDDRGRARVSFTLPDNLTTFRIMALAVSRESEFGKARQQIKVNKPLLLLPTLPRFVRVGDDLQAGVVVHNHSGRDGLVAVKAQVQGARLTGPATRQVTVPSGGAAEARFSFSAPTPGQATFRFDATLGDHRDALELKRPVKLPLVVETVASTGSTTTAVAEGLLPASGVRDDVGGLEIALSSSALVGLKGGMEYLMDYPFECLEQTTSRMLPLVLLKDLSEAYGLKQAAGAGELVGKLIARAQQMQRWDGGFSYWPSSYNSYPWISAYATWGLVQARDAGHKVSQRVLDRARAYLKGQLRRREPRGEQELQRQLRRNTRAYLAYVLVAMGEKKLSGDLTRLYEKRQELASFGKALLLSALVKSGGDKLMIDGLARELTNQVLMTDRTARVEDNLGDGYAPLFHSNLRSTAMVLDALLLARPDHLLVDKLVRYLVDARKDGRWGNTQETVYALLGLHRYYQVRERETPDFMAKVFLGEQKLVQQVFRERTLKLATRQLPMKALLGGGGDKLGFVKMGRGRLHYSASLRYARATLPTRPWDGGFYVTRSYERVGSEVSSLAGLRGKAAEATPAADGAPQVIKVKAGDLVRVTLGIIVPQQMHFVAVDDPLPAGLEAVNFKLMTAARSQSRHRRHSYRSGHGPRSGGSSWYTPFYHQELRDDRVQLFADSVAPGIYNYVYLARATTVGSFVAPPTHVEQMYEPEVFGRTGAARFEVSD